LPRSSKRPAATAGEALWSRLALKVVEGGNSFVDKAVLGEFSDYPAKRSRRLRQLRSALPKPLAALVRRVR